MSIHKKTSKEGNISLAVVIYIILFGSAVYFLNEMKADGKIRLISIIVVAILSLIIFYFLLKERVERKKKERIIKGLNNKFGIDFDQINPIVSARIFLILKTETLSKDEFDFLANCIKRSEVEHIFSTVG